MFTAMGSAAEGVDSSSSAPGDLSPSSPTPAPAPTSDGSTPAVKAPRPPKEKKAPKQAPPPRIIQVAKPKKERVKDKEDEGPYSTTIRLPVTEFSMRANAVVREPQIQAFWAENRVYESLLETNPGEPYTLHDGPPYANGDLHIGHALNKVLKDFINRYQQGTLLVPGWDTHGLPIELKVLQALPEAERRGLGPLELRQKAAAYALKTVEAQREQFKRYGVWADWSAPYITLQPSYEAAQLGVFGKMYLNGHIYRGRKPVHWSPSSRTALAEAELEYPEGHVSQSIYVALPITGAAAQTPPALASELLGASLAIWTTTPWTIPANLAVAINADLEYCLVEATPRGLPGCDACCPCASDTTIMVRWAPRGSAAAWLSRDLVASLAETLGVALTQLGDAFKGAVLEGVTYSHPLYTRTSPVVIGGDYITTETGTGLVHTAPGHGQEDYLVGQRYGLELLSPVDDAGDFTEEAGPQFVGLSVQGAGNIAVITALSGVGALLKQEAYPHKYPYDWRTKKPTIFRATSQWFASVDGFKASALAAIRTVAWVPAGGQTRITNMTEGRNDWCISRQRKWGVPIPVFYDIESGEPLLTPSSLAHITQLVAAHGTDIWWVLPVAQLLPPDLAHLAPTLRRGDDTMDVWFDSGSSWAGVLQAGEEAGLRYPADLYLEGTDQHRGWFQSSLLTSVAANGIAPYKQVLTHGFVLDERGLKMSKSLGNTVDPRVVMEGGKDEKVQPAYGADVLRLWVASVDYTADVMIGNGILKQTSEMARKLRGTLRFLLGNLNDYSPATQAVPYESLPAIDRYMLFKLGGLMDEIAAAYESFQFFRIFQSLQRYVVQDLSNFYLDVSKDRLYTRAADDPSRRACQTVLDATLRALLAALAPLAPHTAEDAWMALPYPVQSKSVFSAGWKAPEAQWSTLPAEEVRLWSAVAEIRDAVNVVLEKARVGKMIGSSLEASVEVHVGDEGVRQGLLRLDGSGSHADEMRYLFMASQVHLLSDPASTLLAPYHDALTPTSAPASGGISIGVSRASGSKCARCWNYSLTLGTGSSAHPELCERCAPVITRMGFVLPEVTVAKVAEAVAVAV
ncbi:MAG: hypothetical protein WDW36_006833 [Sanguina aurantia]